MAQLVKNPTALGGTWVQENWVQSLAWEDPLEKGMATHCSILAWRIPWTSPWGRKESDTTEQLSQDVYEYVYEGFPHSLVGKEYTCNAGDPSSIPGSGRPTGEGIGYPLQYSGLENSIDCIVHGVTKSRTRLSGFHFISLGLPWWLSW